MKKTDKGTKDEVVQVIAEMMNDLDIACDRIRDADELLDLTEEEKARLEMHGEELKSAILSIKSYFRGLESLDAEVRKALEPHLR